MHLYAADVRVFDTWGVWSYEGAEAWQRAVEGWFTSLGTERVKVGFSDVRTVVGKDMASVSAIVTYSGLSAEGTQLRAMQNRITWVLRVIGHVARIVHEHTRRRSARRLEGHPQPRRGERDTGALIAVHPAPERSAI